jgi:PAS domain S-box-containing protein
MADLIAFTYEQRWKLKQEVEERTVLMEELSEKNEELLLQEAKTQALFTDVTLANQVLIQQNEEIRALNDDILEKSQAITSQLAALKASDLLLLKLKTSVEQSESIVVITDNGGVIEYVNQAFTHVTGFIPAEVVGKSTRILQSGYHDKAFYRQMWTTIKSGATWKGEFFNRRKNGETFWETSIITPIKNEANEIVSYIAIKEDITDARDAQNKLARFNKIIASSHKQITASIDYAKRIQGAVLPKLNALSPFFSEHFVLFKPRDTVSGDFHFVQAHKNFIFIAAVDCTGHGVPGAFMSMMGITFLHEIVSQPDGVSAAQALDLLRQKLKQALYQDGESREQHDSMDIAFACIDTQTKILSFAGAYNSLLIFREGVMHKLQADRMPIGVHRKEKPFTNHEFQLQTDDVLYFFTDGYYSQFNHQTKDKMLAKNFINLLQEIHKNTLDQQHTLLTNYLQQWQGTEPQVDDILVIGLRL